VDGYLVKRINRVLKIGFQQDWTAEERADVVNEYRRALRHHPKWVLAQAIDLAVRSSQNRPTPGNINAAAYSVTKSIHDEIRRRQSNTDRQRDASRIPTSKDEASAIMAASGFTPKQFDAVKKRPLAGSMAQLDDYDSAPTEAHWTTRVADDSQQMIALRKARSENKMMRASIEHAKRIGGAA
tara:strand:+ start:5660 stop:6208 length:549 start_codon:yes stop_codon:yes gene_type:complete